MLWRYFLSLSNQKNLVFSQGCQKSKAHITSKNSLLPRIPSNSSRKMGLTSDSEDLPVKKGRHRKKALFNNILQQMEFYFGDSNLSKDRFLGQLLQEDPYVDLEVFLKFNKIRKLNASLNDLQKAIKKSDLLSLSEDGLKVCRVKPLVQRNNVDDCTIYVESIKSDANHEWLSALFSEFGNVTYVSIPKYKHNQANKGFAFVEFESEKDAEAALDFFESIGSKMPSERNPEELLSIATFEGEGKNVEEEENLKKRKLNEEQVEENPPKKIKFEDPEEEDTKRKKKCKKDNKKKTYIKELGIQILSKKDWKKMRNRYLDLQRKKMKEFKQYLTKAKFNRKNEKTKRIDCPQGHTIIVEEATSTQKDPPSTEFQPGVIVKLTLPEPCQDLRKLKNDIKSACSDVKYVDIPLTASDNVYIRFSSSEAATEYCRNDVSGTRNLLTNAEETSYWEKIQNDRTNKFNKSQKKQRGRDKLRKKAEKEIQNHIRFEEVD